MLCILAGLAGIVAGSTRYVAQPAIRADMTMKQVADVLGPGQWQGCWAWDGTLDYRRVDALAGQEFWTVDFGMSHGDKEIHPMRWHVNYCPFSACPPWAEAAWRAFRPQRGPAGGQFPPT